MKPFAAIALVLLCAHGAAAQTRTGLETLPVDAGEQVLVLRHDGTRVNGRIRALTAASLQIDTADGLTTIPAADVGRIIVKDSLRNGTLIGLGAGAAGGAVFGVLLQTLCRAEGADCAGPIAIVVATAAAAGAGVGAGLDTLLHTTVLDTAPGLPHEYTPEVIAALGLGRSGASGLATNGSPIVGGAWSLALNNGFSLEFDFNRTIRSSVRVVTCADAPRGGVPGAVPNAGCAGEGREGLQNAAAGAMKVLYHFSNARVQPYVAGGVALYRSSVWYSLVVPDFRQDFRTRNLYVSESLSRATGIAAVAGAGVRAQITPRVSVRPDVTVYLAGRLSQVRAGVGLGYRW